MGPEGRRKRPAVFGQGPRPRGGLRPCKCTAAHTFCAKDRLLDGETIDTSPGWGSPVHGPGQGARSTLTTASASISTSIAGSINRCTCTIVAAGRMLPKNSPCARPISRQLSMSVTKRRVRTTSAKVAPQAASARSMLCRACTVYASGSPAPTMPPSSPIAVMPAAWMVSPTRTARE